jgi:hypothetical protein
VHVDAVANRRRVLELLVPVGFTYRDVVADVVIALEDGQDPLGREAVDRRHDRRGDQAAVGERQIVEAVVDQIELAGTLERSGDVQRLPDLRVQCRVLCIPRRCRADQACARDRVRGGEQRDVDPACDQPFGQERGELLPRSVVARRHPPGDRREYPHTQTHARRPGTATCRVTPFASSSPHVLPPGSRHRTRPTKF